MQTIVTLVVAMAVLVGVSFVTAIFLDHVRVDIADLLLTWLLACILVWLLSWEYIAGHAELESFGGIPFGALAAGVWIANFPGRWLGWLEWPGASEDFLVRCQWFVSRRRFSMLALRILCSSIVLAGIAFFISIDQKPLLVTLPLVVTSWVATAVVLLALDSAANEDATELNLDDWDEANPSPSQSELRPTKTTEDAHVGPDRISDWEDLERSGEDGWPYQDDDENRPS